MAENDASRTAAEPLTTEEAERLSEQFRPSWEEAPPAVKREPSAPRPVAPQPAQAAPRAPVVSVTAPQPAPMKPQAAPPKPAPTPVAGATTATAVPLALTRRATLLGGAAPQPPKAEASARRGQGVDDLDWEDPSIPVTAPAAAPLASPAPDVAVPLTRPATAPAAVVTQAGPARGPDDTQKLPAVAAAVAPAKREEADFEVHVEVEELPPESKPSGIGQKYIPKEEGAPPVVLGPDVEAAERGASVDLEAEHRRRRAPTILKMKAFEGPPAGAVDAVPDFAAPRRKGSGLLVVLAVLMVLGAAGAAAFLVRRGGANETAKPADRAAVPTTATEATPRPVPEAAPAAKASAQEAASPPPEEPSKDAPPEKAEAAAAPAKPAGATAAKPAARPAPAKPAKPTGAGSPKPAAGPRPASPSGAKGAIVRDTPF